MKEIIQGDCLEIMKTIPDKSIDMILCDLPYGTTACKWDTIIPFEPLWKQYERIIKDNGAIVLTSSQPFTSALVMSNPEYFKYSWIWEKQKATGFLDSKKRPLKAHEDVLVFSKKSTMYHPQMTAGVPYDKGFRRTNADGSQGAVYGLFKGKKIINKTGSRYPRSVFKFKTEHGLHPTQKPLALFEYLIKTYTKEGDLVLDNCAGSGTTGVACVNLKRNFILIEKEDTYIEIIKNRLSPP